MGLTTWKNAPDGRILKSDTPIAKNYLDEKQIHQLERAVTGYFDYIEDLIERENVFTMEEFSKSVNEFLAFRRYDILKDNGRISFIRFAKNQFIMYQLIHEKEGIRKLYESCYRDNLHSLWAGQELYRKRNSEEEFINILEKNMQPVYDSARRQGYEVWNRG